MGRHKKTPYDECVWEISYLNNEEYVITSPSFYDRSSYTLWKKNGDSGWVKLGSGKTPPQLYEKYIEV